MLRSVVSETLNGCAEAKPGHTIDVYSAHAGTCASTNDEAFNEMQAHKPCKLFAGSYSSGEPVSAVYGCASTVQRAQM
jgi:hypothetical protein